MTEPWMGTDPEWARARSEWSVAVPFSLMLLAVLASPLLYDALQWLR